MMAEKIRVALIKRKRTLSELAQSLRISQSNLSNKLKRDNFSEKEMEEISAALNVILHCEFEIPETGERI